MKLTLKHDGAYIAKFEVTWENGCGGIRNWDGNHKHRTAGFKTVIDIPEDASNIKVVAKGRTGLNWDPWHTPCNVMDFPNDVDREVLLYGTTLRQCCRITPTLERES